MENYRDLMGQAKKLFDDVRAIVGNKDAPPEEHAKVNQMMADAQELKAKALQLKEIEDSISEVLPHIENKNGGKDPAVAERKDKTPFTGWGEFLYASWRALNPQVKSGPDPRLQWYEDKDEAADNKGKKDLGESTGAGGGFLVPVEQSTSMQAIEGEQALFVPRATMIRMRRRQVGIPVLDQTGTTAGVPHWFGGILFYHGEENTEKTESDPAFRQVILTAHKLYGYTRSGDELLDDEAI